MRHRRFVSGLIGGIGVAGALALAAGLALAEPAETGGLVVQAWPWRTQDGARVMVDYTVQLEKGTATPGTLLAAYRQNRVGRSEGPPLIPVGWLTVVSAQGGVAVARAVPAQAPLAAHVRNPVVEVGDTVRLAGDPAALGAASSSIDLAKVFPAGDAVLAADADKVLAELVKPLSKGPGKGPESVLVVIYGGVAAGASPGGTSPGASGGGAVSSFEQAAAVSRRVASLLALDSASVYAVTAPAGSGSAGPRIEVRALAQPETGGSSKRAGAP